ncbi:MAG: prolyl oligopeptidase family serine peptidase [Cyclonatronaceae bacterium]
MMLFVYARKTASSPSAGTGLLLLFLLLFSPFQQAAVHAQDAETQPVQATDFLHIRQLSQLSLSPDGQQAVYVSRQLLPDAADAPDNFADYSYRNQLWLVPADGSQPPRQLTFSEAGASQPAWHPDGKHLAFSRAKDGKSQLYVMSLDGGEAVQITRHPQGASNPQWSPDGRRLLFSASYSHADLLEMPEFSAGPEWPEEKPGIAPQRNQAEEAEANPDGSLAEIRAWLGQQEQDEDPIILNRLRFQGEFNLDPYPDYTHWLVLEAGPEADESLIMLLSRGDVAQVESRPLTLSQGFLSFSGAAWMPDSREVLFSASAKPDEHPDRVQESSLYRMSVLGGEPEPYVSRQHFSYTNPAPSPNGRYVAFRAFDTRDPGYNQAEIGLLDTQAGAVSHHGNQAVDRAFGNMKWSSDSRYVYATAPANGGFPLYRVDVRSGNLAVDQSLSFEQLTNTQTGIRDYALHRNRLLFVQTSAENPFELYTADADAQNAGQISDHNASWIAERELSTPEKFTFTTDDGFEIEYWVMPPVGYTEGESYPTLLQIHGGPSAMWGTGEASMWHEFQLFAAQGFGIVYANPRGSGGYGKDFQKGNHQDWGVSPMNDVLGALDAAMESHAWMDEDRLTVTGGSYGGYLVAYIVAMDQRFKAAAAQRGVYELNTFFGEGNAFGLVEDRFGGYPWQEDIFEILRHDSPFTFVDQIETPLLILHGNNDLRTGVSQSEMMYRALKVLERPVEYVRYPNAGHDLSRTGAAHQRLDRLLRMVEFMKRYVQE